MATEVLGPAALNRAVLARQLLLERSALSITETLDQIAGIQNQYAPNGYLGLWSRMRSFSRDDLTRALETREVVQGTSLRATIHLATPWFFKLSNDAVRGERLEWWLRTSKQDPGEIRKAAELIAAALADGPRKRGHVIKQLGVEPSAWNGATMLLDLIRVPPSGTWENRRADLYELLPHEPDASREALATLVACYLRAFGPASLTDTATFLGLKPATIRPLLAAYTPGAAEDGTELFDVSDGLRPDPETPAPPRFLAPWEAILLVHARRSGILPETYRPLIFNTKMPQSTPTFLIDGRVAGTWRLDENDLRVTPFGTLDRAAAKSLEEEAERLRSFIA